MPARRGSAFYRSEMARMLDQFKPGYLVAPTFISSPNDALRGTVTAVNRVENKVYVAWNGGSVKQHDPDELMIVSMPVNVNSQQIADQHDAVVDNPTSHEEFKQEQDLYHERKASHVGRRMASLPPKFMGDPATHGMTEPVSGGTNVVQNLQKKLHVESETLGRRMASLKKNKINSSRRMAMYHRQPGRYYKRTRAEVDSDGATCPKCGETMELQPFTKSEKIWTCPDCGWKITTSRVLASQ